MWLHPPALDMKLTSNKQLLLESAQITIQNGFRALSTVPRIRRPLHYSFDRERSSARVQRASMTCIEAWKTYSKASEILASTLRERRRLRCKTSLRPRIFTCLLYTSDAADEEDSV